MLGLGHSAIAIDLSKSLTQLNHARWTEKDGGPAEVKRIAQSADGMLWLATRDGLYRFDGLHFSRLPSGAGESLPSSYISAVLATKGGGVLVGHDMGITWIGPDGPKTYGAESGLPAGPPAWLAERAPGEWWAVFGKHGLFSYREGRWRGVGKDAGYEGVNCYEMLVDRDATLWLTAENGVWFKRRGEAQFGRVQPRRTNARLALAPDGRVWGGGSDGLWYIDESKPDDVRSRLVTRSASDTVLFDRHGALWRQILAGLQRSVKGGDLSKLPEVQGSPNINTSPDLPVPTESFLPESGLTSDVISTLFEDREGNIWVGTSGGLERFRDQRLALVEFPRRRSAMGLAAASDGAIWAGNWDKALMRWKGGLVQEFPQLGTHPTVLHRDGRGDLWFSLASAGFFHEHDGKFTQIPPPPNQPPKLHYMTQAVASDRLGNVYVSFGRKDLFQLRDGHWTELTSHLPTDTAVRSLFADDVGRLWVGTQNSVLMIEGGRGHLYRADEGMRIGQVSAFMQRRGRLWAAGQQGIAVLDGKAWRMIKTRMPKSFEGATALVQSDDGAVWVHSKGGINRIDATDANAIEEGRAEFLPRETLDALDGLQGQADSDRPLPSAIKADDGRIWFGTTRGAFWLDPRVRPTKVPVPAPQVDYVRVDGQVLSARKNLQLPPGTTQVVLAYAAASLAYPERVRYWFRLDGIDEEWTAAGASREARYTNLKPGAYRFHVVAADVLGGPETGAETQLEFVVLPAYYQTWWARTGLGIAIALMGLFAYRAHLNRRVRRAGELLQAGLSERENIARELHDTLLQNVQALMLLFQAAANRVTPEGGARDAVNTCLSKAEILIAEGRRQIVAMRNEAQAVALGLQPALEAVAEDFGALSEAKYVVVVGPMDRELRPGLAEALYRIAREAMFNAARHARARHIRVSLTSGKSGVALSVTDDGRGIPSEVVETGYRSGHMGLPGMRARASKFGGVLAIRNLAGGGAAVTLDIPARRAFAWRPWRAFAVRPIDDEAANPFDVSPPLSSRGPSS